MTTSRRTKGLASSTGLSRARAIVGLLRPLNCLALAALYLGVFRRWGGGASWSGEGVAGAIAWALLAGAGYCWNDVCDVEIDRAGHPERPLPRGIVQRATAQWMAVALAAAAVGLAWTEGWWLGGSVTVVAGMCWVYSSWLRPRSSLGANLLCAGMVAAVPLSGFRLGLRAALAIGTYAFVLTLARELAKDWSERDSDRTARPKPALAAVPGAGLVALRWIMGGAVVVLGGWTAMRLGDGLGAALVAASAALAMAGALLAKPVGAPRPASSVLLKSAAYLLAVSVWSPS
jgi:geranylgeranylglycerol-phosphate geranylgeranyltransferase